MAAIDEPLRPRSSFRADLRRAMLEDFEPDLLLACRYAVLRAAGFSKIEVSRKLDVTPHALRLAEQRVTRAAERLDAGG